MDLGLDVLFGVTLGVTLEVTSVVIFEKSGVSTWTSVLPPLPIGGDILIILRGFLGSSSSSGIVYSVGGLAATLRLRRALVPATSRVTRGC